MATKRATPAKAKAPVAKVVKPKVMEVGYKFPIMAELVEVNPEGDDSSYPFTITLNIGKNEDYDTSSDGTMNVYYATKKDFINLVTKYSPNVSKEILQEELKQAQAVVDKLTKELAELK